jgi:hypothetical protein
VGIPTLVTNRLLAVVHAVGMLMVALIAVCVAQAPLWSHVPLNRWIGLVMFVMSMPLQIGASIVFGNLFAITPVELKVNTSLPDSLVLG